MKEKRGKKIKIKAIFFDIGGVLAIPKKTIKDKKGEKITGVHTIISKKLGISIDQWFDSIESVYYKSIEGKISEKRFLEIISMNNRISKGKMKKIVIDSYRSIFKQNKELFKKALELKKLGYKIGVLSDQWHLSRDALVIKKFYRIFDKAIISCEVGLRKPSEKIYRLAAKSFNLKPSEILFIDNQSWNISSAKKLGVKTILFKDNPQLFKNKLWNGLFKK